MAFHSVAIGCKIPACPPLIACETEVITNNPCPQNQICRYNTNECGFLSSWAFFHCLGFGRLSTVSGFLNL